MHARVLTASLFGVEAVPVTVEADVGRGLPRFAIIGLPDSAVREATERVRTAVQRTGLEWPSGRIVVNLAPANLRKGGTGLDLAIAVALLAAAGSLPPRKLAGWGFLGELGLTGELRPVRGALAVADTLFTSGAKRLLAPLACAQEAALVPGLAAHPAQSLAEACAILKQGAGEGIVPARETTEPRSDEPDLADICGQQPARRALEVAAAGGHNILFFGPPGSGKTLLARRLPGLLPPPDDDEALEITLIASCAGDRPAGRLLRTRPFRAPHHTVTGAALVGGGAIPRPGEVTLAHRGVLFLDELAEFPRVVLDRLRQPLEEGEVILSRAGRHARFPSRFLLVGATNPCPCGHLGDPARPCTCTPPAVSRYRAHLSGPLLDRIDLHVEVPRLAAAEMRSGERTESTADVRRRVLTARAIQSRRYASTGMRVNADLEGVRIAEHVCLSPPSRAFIEQAVDRLALSGRAQHRILKIARTLADLEGATQPDETMVAEAVGYRLLDRAAPPT